MKHTKIKLSSMFVYIVVFILMTFSVNAAQSAVDLGTSGNFVVLTKTGISTTGTTAITGDVGVSPIDGTAVTGFGLIMDSTNTFSKSTLVTGKIYAANYASPTSTILTTAINDMQTAYTDAAGRTDYTATELGAGDISGLTIAPGLYKWGTGVLINNGITISGSSTDIWIFQIAQDLIVGNGAIITLSGGAQAKNIYWQVAGGVTLGTTSDFKGIILSKTAIAMNTGATLNGKALAQTAVTLDSNAITSPGVASTSNTNNEESNEETNNANTQEQYENKDETETTAQEDSTDESVDVTNLKSQVTTTKNDQGIGQELNTQITQKREEIKSGAYYTNDLGKLLIVKELTNDLKELRINNVVAQTELSIDAQTDSNGKTKFKTYLKNGELIEIKIMPDTALEMTLEKLRFNLCSSDNNCIIQLKSIGNKEVEEIQYEIQLERHSKMFGIFQKTMYVTVDVDAETGVTKVHKPWWAFMATEPAEIS